MAILTDYSKEWRRLYKAEAKRIKKAFGLSCTATYHIGATAIKNMPARPEIDLLVVLTEKADLRNLADLGYTYAQDGTYTLHTDGMDYTVRLTKRKPQLHVDTIHGAATIESYLAYVMYLSENKDAAETFAEKKREIADKHENDLDAYKAAKKQLIEEIAPAALQYKRQRDIASVYLPTGMCIGMCIGMCFGVAMNNIPIGMCVGMSVGMCMGLVLGRVSDKPDKK